MRKMVLMAADEVEVGQLVREPTRDAFLKVRRVHVYPATGRLALIFDGSEDPLDSRSKLVVWPDDMVTVMIHA